MEYLTAIVRYHINNNISDGKVANGELLRWIGCWYIMSTITGPLKLENVDISIFSGVLFAFHQ
jgi:hypothetical protein